MTVAAWLATPSAAEAASLDIDLGASAQDFILYGQGAYAAGLGSFTIQQGDESYDSASNTTTDTLSGAISSATDPRVASGSYAFATTYQGTPIGSGGMQLQGESEAANPNFFTYSYIDATLSMTLYLTGAPAGDSTIPVFENGNFDAGVSFDFTSASCSGVTSCGQNEVGLTPGASIYGPVAISVSTTTNAIPEPSTWAMMCVGFAGLGFAAYRRARPTVERVAVSPASRKHPIGMNRRDFVSRVCLRRGLRAWL